MLKEIDVEKILEELKLEKEKTWVRKELKVSWNGEEISAYSEFDDFDKDIDKIREKLENLKILVENSEEWDKKIKDGAEEYLLEVAQDWWSDTCCEEEDIPEQIKYLTELVNREDAEKMVKERELSGEAFKKLIYVDSIRLEDNDNFEICLFDIDQMIFWGHILFVYGNMNGEFYDGEIMG